MSRFDEDKFADSPNPGRRATSVPSLRIPSSGDSFENPVPSTDIASHAAQASLSQVGENPSSTISSLPASRQASSVLAQRFSAARELRKREEELERLIGELRKREEKLRKREQELESREIELQEREEKLRKRVQELEGREEDLREREEELWQRGERVRGAEKLSLSSRELARRAEKALALSKESALENEEVLLRYEELSFRYHQLSLSSRLLILTFEVQALLNQLSAAQSQRSIEVGFPKGLSLMESHFGCIREPLPSKVVSVGIPVEFDAVEFVIAIRKLWLFYASVLLLLAYSSKH